MPSNRLSAIFLIAACALSTGASAQKIYKCGSSYSQAPCVGGLVVDTADQRSNAQKTQTDLATARDAKVADAMEAARLKKEKSDLAANTPMAALVEPVAASPDVAHSTESKLKPNKKAPTPFTAQVPGTQKKKTALNKKAKAAKKKASKA